MRFAYCALPLLQRFLPSITVIGTGVEVEVVEQVGR